MNGLKPELCSVHTHSAMCDGKNSLEEMARAAFEAGVRYFGASGHSHTPVPEDQGNVLPEDPADYRREVLRLREAYAGRMEILLGIEQDSCARTPVPAWADYWVGSVHHLEDPERPGSFYPVDWDAERLREGVRVLGKGDPLALAERYYGDVAAMAQRKPTILGHIDLVTKFNEQDPLFDEEDPRYRRAALEALHAADPQATLLEINTGAMARGYRTRPYPARFLLEQWRAMGGRVILTADAHAASGILYAYDRAAEWGRAAGFPECGLLTGDGVIPCAL